MRVSRKADGSVGHVDVRVAGRMAKLITGELDLSELDDEELARGRLKDKNGRFTGRPPAAIPRAVADAMLGELLKRGQEKFKESYVEAIEVLGLIARDPEAADSDRIKAANLIIERIGGKVPDRVKLESVDPWQQIIDEIVVGDTKPAKAKKA